MGPPDDAVKPKIIARFDRFYPAKERYLNADLCQLLVYLQAPSTAAKTIKLLAEAPTQEEQMEYAKSLRMLKTGWTPKLRQEYFKWFVKAANFKGGNCFGGFMDNIKKDAVATLTADEKTTYKSMLEAKPDPTLTVSGPPRPVVKQYKMDELAALIDKGSDQPRLRQRPQDVRRRQLLRLPPLRQRGAPRPGPVAIRRSFQCSRSARIDCRAEQVDQRSIRQR